MRLEIELTEKEVTQLVMNRIGRLLGDVNIKREDVRIEVKSKQNYKSEWEPAMFRARVVKY